MPAYAGVFLVAFGLGFLAVTSFSAAWETPFLCLCGAYMIDVILVDDHRAFLDTLCLYFQIEYEQSIRIIGSFHTGVDAIEFLRQTQPDVLLLDVEMPDGVSGLEIIHYVQQNHPAVGVLVLTAQLTSKVVHDFLQADAKGIVGKERPMSEIVEAIQRIAKGGRYLSDRAVELSIKVMQEKGHPIDKQQIPPIELTPREKEIIRYVALGMSSKEIGLKLHMSHHTVEKHRKLIMQKLGFSKMTSVIQYAIKHKIIILE